MVDIRRGTPADRDAVLALVPLLVQFGPPPWRDTGTMTGTDLEVIDQALRSTTEDPVVVVAHLEGMLAGFMHLHSLEDYDRRTRHGHVADIVVAPFARGRGIATTLLAEAENWAIRSGFDWLSLSVFEQNRHALEIYERHGFSKDIVRLVKPLGRRTGMSEARDEPLANDCFRLGRAGQ